MQVQQREVRTIPARSPSRLTSLIPTIFHNPWWLDAASGGNYQQVEVRSGGKVVARLPFIAKSAFPLQHRCFMPEATHYLGPALEFVPGSRANRQLKEYQWTRELLAQLDSFGSFHQQLHRGVQDTLAFEAAGFNTSVNFTYEIAPQPLDILWSELRDKTRNVIRRAQDRWEVVTMNDPEGFAAAYQANLQRRGLANIYTRMGAVCEAAIAHQQGKILAVKDGAGALVGATFIVWDEVSAYYLLSTRSEEADNSVMSLLVWRAMEFAAQAGLIFDFDGLGTAGSRVFYTGFGGQVKPRYVVSRHSLGHRGVHAMSRICGRLFGKEDVQQ